jgi:PKD domain
VARSDDARKRTWRLRLNEGAILEVSAPEGPTEKQVRRRGRISLVLGTAAAALALSAVASADQLDADADSLSTTTPQANSLTANQQPGTTVEYDLSASVDETGNSTDDVFQVAGDTVDVTIARNGDWLASPAGTPASFTFTSYNANQAGKIRITVPCGTSAGTSRSMAAVVTAGASYNALNSANSNGNTLNPSPQTLTYTITAQGSDAASCAPPANGPPIVDADTTDAGYSGTEGSGIALNRATATDTDGPGPLSYLWTIEGAPSVDGGSCSLNNATSLTAATIACTDNGTATVKLTATEAGVGGKSGSDTASVTINNANPAFDSGQPAFASAKVNCTANTVTLNFGFSDAGSNDTHTSTISWGDGSAVQTFDETATALESASHTYNSGGPYTAVVNVTDDDAGSTGSTNSTNSLIVEYNTSGILQPVNDTRNGQQPSMFKYKSTIPVKIKVTDCDGSVVSTLAPIVSFKKLSGEPPTEGTDEAASTVPPTDGVTMRWDSAGQQYIYNLATKQLGTDSSATYRITVAIQAGQTVSADIGIKP